MVTGEEPSSPQSGAHRSAMAAKPALAMNLLRDRGVACMKALLQRIGQYRELVVSQSQITLGNYETTEPLHWKNYS